MIQMSNDMCSVKHRNDTVKSWREHGYNVRYYQAVTPKTLDKQSQPIQFGKKRDKIEFTDTEKAVWYSHRNLWRFCEQKMQPIIIIEHDAKLVKDIPCNLFDECDIIGLSHTPFINRKTGETDYDRILRSAGVGYYLTPQIATKMVLGLNKKIITTNSDCYIHIHIEELGGWNIEHIQQTFNEEYGTTIEHN